MKGDLDQKYPNISEIRLIFGSLTEKRRVERAVAQILALARGQVRKSQAEDKRECQRRRVSEMKEIERGHKNWSKYVGQRSAEVVLETFYSVLDAISISTANIVS